MTDLTQYPNIKKYSLIWDAGNGYIATYCKTTATANQVFKELIKIGLKPHQMKTDKKIIVLYF